MNDGLRFNDSKPDFSLMPLGLYPESDVFNRESYLKTKENVRLFEECLRSIADFVELCQDCKEADVSIDILVSARKALRSMYFLCSSLDFDFLEKVVRVYDYGAEKYSRFNWQKGMNWSVIVACAMRHIHAIDRYKDFFVTDSESGQPHYAHVISNLQMINYYAEQGIGINDFKTQ